MALGKTLHFTGEFIGETCGGPGMYTNPPTQESAPEAPNLLWVAGEVTECLNASQEPSKQHCSLSDPRPPTNSTTTQQHGLPHPGKYLRPHPLLYNRYTETK